MSVIPWQAWVLWLVAAVLIVVGLSEWRLARERRRRREIAVRVLLGEQAVRRAIGEHRCTIEAAGEVLVAPWDRPLAEVKHEADRRLWELAR